MAYAYRGLLWRPVGELVRFVFVRHPRRGDLILLSPRDLVKFLERIRDPEMLRAYERAA